MFSLTFRLKLKKQYWTRSGLQNVRRNTRFVNVKPSSRRHLMNSFWLDDFWPPSQAGPDNVAEPTDISWKAENWNSTWERWRPRRENKPLLVICISWVSYLPLVAPLRNTKRVGEFILLYYWVNFKKRLKNCFAKPYVRSMGRTIKDLFRLMVF